MIGRRIVLALGLVLGLPAAPALAQITPEIQEMIDKIHLGNDGPMIPIEQSTVFERTPAGDYKHKPSGFICAHAMPALGEFKPGFTTIFDDAKKGHDVGCGLIKRGVTITIFVFDPKEELADVFNSERAAAREADPPREDTQPVAVSPAEYGLPAATPFANDTWIDKEGTTQSVNVAQFGTWFVHVRVTAEAGLAAAGKDAAKWVLGQAAQQIPH